MCVASRIEWTCSFSIREIANKILPSCSIDFAEFLWAVCGMVTRGFMMCRGVLGKCVTQVCASLGCVRHSGVLRHSGVDYVIPI